MSLTSAAGMIVGVVIGILEILLARTVRHYTRIIALVNGFAFSGSLD